MLHRTVRRQRISLGMARGFRWVDNGANATPTCIKKALISSRDFGLRKWRTRRDGGGVTVVRAALPALRDVACAVRTKKKGVSGRAHGARAQGPRQTLVNAIVLRPG